MKILAISASSRKGYNTDNLLELFIKRFNFDKEDIKVINLKDLNFKGCQSCYGCGKVPMCVVKDDLTDIYLLIEDADIIIFSSPVYFNSVSYLAKTFIDRMQVYWSRKFILKLSSLKEKFGVALINGGSSVEIEQFLGSELVFDHFFKATGCKNNLFIEISETDKFPINDNNEYIRRLLDNLELNLSAKEKYRLKEGKIEKWN